MTVIGQSAEPTTKEDEPSGDTHEKSEEANGGEEQEEKAAGGTFDLMKLGDCFA